jgi:hypothetical protein
MANQPLNEQQLQALLRLKRHEQPPPGYFDDLLSKVQQRQREEMLKRPAWSLMAERIGAFFSSLRKDWAYVGSMAGVLLIGIGAIQLAVPQKQVVIVAGNSSVSDQAKSLVERQDRTELVTQRLTKPTEDPSRADGVKEPEAWAQVPERFQLAPGTPHKPIGNLREARTLRPGPPRFVIDAQPASYEQTQIQF